MMPMVMSSEMPLPIPFSVIRPPSHITKTVPAVNTMTVVMVKNVGLITDRQSTRLNVSHKRISYAVFC